MTTKTENIGCECENPNRGCRCNSMSIEPCAYCDWNECHGSRESCEQTRYWCEGCDDECEAEGCTYCE
jgi:hypothetical protein